MFSTVCRSACHTTNLGIRSSPFRKIPSSLAYLFHQRRSLASFIPAQECMRRALQVNQEQKKETARGETMRLSLKHMHADKVRAAEEKIKKFIEKTAQHGFPEPINERPTILFVEDIEGINFIEPEAEQLIVDLKAAGYKVEIGYNWAHHALHKYANKCTVALIQEDNTSDDNKYSIFIQFSYCPSLACNRYMQSKEANNLTTNAAEGCYRKKFVCSR